MKNSTRSYPRVHVDTARSGAIAQAGGVLLTRAAEASGLTAALRAELSPWRRPFATHDPGKVSCDVALSLALGGDCLADLALLRAEPGVYGSVASEATLSRTLSAGRRCRRRAAGGQPRPRDRPRTGLGAGRDAGTGLRRDRPRTRW